MKSIKHLLFLALAIILVMSSCSLEKRIYMSDYHIEWTDADRITSPQMVLNGSSKKLIEPNQIVEVDKSEITTYDINNSPNVIDYKNTISTCEKSIVSPKKKRNSIQSSLKKIKRDEVKKGKDSLKFELKKEIKNLISSSEENEEWSNMAIAGFVCSVLGILLLLVPPLAIVLSILGIVFSSIGLRQTRNGKRGRGLAIAGLVIGILPFFLLLVFIALLVVALRSL
jgi:hypothetical protein